MISKIAEDANIKCYYVNLVCNKNTIIERIKERESNFGKEDNYSRATLGKYLEYQEEVKKLKFPKEKIFFEIRTDESLDIQIENLFEKIKNN